MKLTTHLHLVPRSRKVKLNLHSPICLHGIVLNEISTGTTLPFMEWESFMHTSSATKLHPTKTCTTVSSHQKKSSVEKVISYGLDESYMSPSKIRDFIFISTTQLGAHQYPIQSVLDNLGLK
jgi:hypothetical protein